MKNMAKWLSVLLVMTMLLTLFVACKPKDDPAPDPDDEIVDPTPDDPTPDDPTPDDPTPDDPTPDDPTPDDPTPDDPTPDDKVEYVLVDFEDETVEIGLGKKYTLPAATVLDAKGGEHAVTYSVVTAEGDAVSIFSGAFPVTKACGYVVTASVALPNGKTETRTITINVVDTTAPEIVIAAAAKGYAGEEYTLPAITVSDASGDETTQNVKVYLLNGEEKTEITVTDGKFVPEVEGTYLIEVTAKDSKNNEATATAEIEIAKRNDSPDRVLDFDDADDNSKAFATAGQVTVSIIDSFEGENGVLKVTYTHDWPSISFRPEQAMSAYADYDYLVIRAYLVSGANQTKYMVLGSGSDRSCALGYEDKATYDKYDQWVDLKFPIAPFLSSWTDSSLDTNKARLWMEAKKNGTTGTFYIADIWVEKCEHSLSLVEKQDATCTAEGYEAYYACDLCDAMFADAEGNTPISAPTVIPTIAHTPAGATCTAAPTCTVCGAVAGEALGHDMVTDAAKAPTCTETGLTEGSHCSRCDDVTTAQEPVFALGHKYDDDYDADCNVCGAVRDVACKHENTEVLAAVAATCTTSGLTEGKKCLDCNETLVIQEVIGALNHDIINYEGKDATCTEAGITAGSRCSRCDDVTVEQEEIPAQGHKFDDNRDASCNNCDYVRVAPEVTVLDFSDSSEGSKMYNTANNVSVSYVESFEGENGVAKVTYTNDWPSISFRPEQAMSAYADYDYLVIRAYLVSGANQTKYMVLGSGSDRSCALGYEDKATYDKYDQWVDLKFPITPFLASWTDGSLDTNKARLWMQSAKNGVTGTFYIADIWVEKCEHSLSLVEEKAATCLDAGYKAHYICSACDKLFSDVDGTTKIDAPEVIDALGHSFNETNACTICGTEQPSLTKTVLNFDSPEDINNFKSAGQISGATIVDSFEGEEDVLKVTINKDWPAFSFVPEMSMSEYQDYDYLVIRVYVVNGANQVKYFVLGSGAPTSNDDVYGRTQVPTDQWIELRYDISAFLGHWTDTNLNTSKAKIWMQATSASATGTFYISEIWVE